MHTDLVISQFRTLADACVPKRNGCYLWSGARNAAGYGIITDEPGLPPGRLVHELYYEFRHGGPLPPGTVIVTKCRQPHCLSNKCMSLQMSEEALGPAPPWMRDIWPAIIEWVEISNASDPRKKSDARKIKAATEAIETAIGNEISARIMRAAALAAKLE